MISVTNAFTNELGNDIRITITSDDRGVTVEAEGPTSQVEHTWTPMEAKVLRESLQLLEPAYRTM